MRTNTEKQPEPVYTGGFGQTDKAPEVPAVPPVEEPEKGEQETR